MSLNLDLTDGVTAHHVDMLLRIIRDAPAKTFQFAYTFHNRPSSPFFPSATFERSGFAIGLQPTDLSAGCSEAVTTDIFIKITDFLSTHNPKPVGLCGLMLPCLEDFELAEEYEAGRFSIERNMFLALHSGLGVDTYPIGTDDKPKRILQILCLLQKLSAKYEKPLSARFVSDGKTKIGEISDFKNPFLKDVKIRPL